MNLSIQNWLAEHNLEISLLEGISPGQMAGLAFRIVQDMDVKSLSPFDICSLAEVLEQPLNDVRGKIQVIAQLTTHLLHHLSQIKPLQRNEGTWLGFQIAYLHGLQEVLEQEVSLHKGWLDRAMIPTSNSGTVGQLGFPNPQLKTLLNTIRPGKLTDTQAEQALSLIADSLLVQQMNNATIAWLVANGAEEAEAKLIVQRLVHGLPGYLLSVIIDRAAPLAQLQKFVRLGSSSSPTSEQLTENTSPDSSVNDNIDLYLENYRASLLSSRSQPLFMESFTFEDIYIPHKGIPIGAAKQSSLPVDLMTWVQEQLGDNEKIIVIESPSGYGKTRFCQKLAVKAAGKLYPQWMPVLIRLRDITYGSSLINTLASGINSKFAFSFPNILRQNHLRLLLILDGLDELPPSIQGTMAQKMLLQQLLQLQSQGKHQVVLTTTPKVLRELYPEVLPELQRIGIKFWEQDEWRQWFQCWTNVQSLSVAQNYFTFLKKRGIFNNSSPLSALVRQPLMLYLLAILHRDGLWNSENLPSTYKEQTTYISLLWEIYQTLNRWLLGYPATGGMRTMLWRVGSAHIHRTPEAIANLLQGKEPADLLTTIQAIALKILHSQCHYIIDSAASIHYLPNFYLICNQSTVEKNCIRLEFSHPHLGELLCADAIANQLQILTQTQKHTCAQQSFVIASSDAVAHHLYQLLGYGILSEDIEALIWEKLRREDKQLFPWQILCDRLQSFWFDYCSGYWLEQGIANQYLSYFRSLNNPITIEQINAAVGINVFLLLCRVYRQLKTPFSPCGHPEQLSQFYPQALTMLIARSSVLSPHAFIHRTATKSLVSLDLQGAYLSQINLIGANLTDTNLTDANLTGTNLTAVKLTNTNLTNADLTAANLTKVRLDFANLTNTYLIDAIMDDAGRELALSKGAIFLPQQLQMQEVKQKPPSPIRNESWVNTEVLSLNTPEYGAIEVAEGEPMLPPEFDHHQEPEFNPDCDRTEVNPDFHDIQTHA
jgi:hypothetical protein